MLEHFHCYTLFQIINKTELLSSLSQKDVQVITQQIQDLILDTDMSKHFSVVQRQENIIIENTNEPLPNE